MQQIKYANVMVPNKKDTTRAANFSVIQIRISQILLNFSCIKLTLHFALQLLHIEFK